MSEFTRVPGSVMCSLRLSRDAWRLAHSRGSLHAPRIPHVAFQPGIHPDAGRPQQNGIRVGIALLAHRKILKFASRTSPGSLPFESVRLGDQGDDVHAEAVDASVKPPVHHVVHSAGARQGSPS